MGGPSDPETIAGRRRGEDLRRRAIFGLFAGDIRQLVLKAGFDPSKRLDPHRHPTPMPTIADPATLDRLVRRLEALRPDTPGRWGTLAAEEMVCHLADAHALVMDPHGLRAGPRWRPVMKWIALYAPLAWPRNFKSPARIDQRKGGTKPTLFGADRQRAIDTLRGLAAAPAEAWPPSHAVFGTLTAADWRVWAFRHTDHHLRQFGL